MAELYEMIVKVAIEKVETPSEELSGLLFPIRTPVILPIGDRVMFSPDDLKEAEALSTLFRAAEIYHQIFATCNTGGKNP